MNLYRLTTEQTAMETRVMEELWKVHTDEEFLQHDVEATLATMTEDAFVLNIPTGMGGRGTSPVGMGGLGRSRSEMIGSGAENLLSSADGRAG